MVFYHSQQESNQTRNWNSETGQYWVHFVSKLYKLKTDPVAGIYLWFFSDSIFIEKSGRLI